jgi:Gas vesicle synthesis protein GvpL/GvpF.
MSRPDRYVYCIAGVDGTETPSIETTGVEDNPVELLVTDGVGVATHTCDGLYDTDDEATVTQWLLSHQSVVDAVGDSFGTPIPVRFDTVFEGAEGVKRWVSTHRDQIDDTLERLAGRREYRITLLWDRAAFTTRVADEDETLRELAQRRDAASEGTEYMIERQYQRHLDDRVRSRENELTAALVDAVDPVVVDSVELDPADSQRGGEESDLDQVTRLTVLADESAEGTLGERLDEIAARDGLTVRFTGPWPPYAFTPEFESVEP